MRYRDALIGLLIGLVVAFLLYSNAPNPELWAIVPLAGALGGHWGGLPGRRRANRTWAIIGALIGGALLALTGFVIYIVAALFIFGFAP